jgi:hypothetical protein
MIGRMMTDSSKEARARADARFKRSQTQAREGAEAAAQYEAAGKQLRERTERLKALRLAREAAAAAEVPAPKAKKATPRKKAAPVKKKPE